MFQKKMKIMNPCPRCKTGTVLREYGDYACLQCGYDPIMLVSRRANLAYIERLRLAGLRPPWGEYVNKD